MRFGAFATAGSAVSLVLCFSLTAAESPARLHGNIKETELYTLKGNTKPMLALAQDNGEVSDAQPLPHLAVHFQMTSQQQEDLSQLLRQQQTRGSSQYHKFLTPEEYGDRFGPNSEDVAKVTAWLSAQGFSNVQVARSRMFVSFDGIAAQARAAFHTSIHRYTFNGESHYANTSDPQLPAALQGMVESIRGLHDFKMKPLGIRKHAHWTSNISGNHFVAPADFGIIYNATSIYNAGTDGTGVKIAIAGQSDIQLSDIRAFRSAAGLPANDPQIVVTGTDPGIQQSSGDQLESDLDVEWAGAVAKNATIVFVTATDVSTATAYAIDNNVAPILAMSYGLCESDIGQTEANTEQSQYQQANAQGMTVIASSGDAGAADCDTAYPARRGLAVDVPASLPNVTGIGGTNFSEGSGNYWAATNTAAQSSALSYIPETGWNDSSASNGLSASGGGASLFSSKPSWQTGVGVPNDAARHVPDLSFAASPDHDSYLVCSNGDCVNGFRNTDTTLHVVGGTSIGPPVFAGILALLEESLGPQGNANPDLYAIAAQTPAAFHDITTGNNIVACVTGTPNCTNGSMGFSAGPGYDQVTGLGSVDISALINAWISLTASQITSSKGPLAFVPLQPCRVADTRNTPDAFGGPEMSAGSTREFDVPNSKCNIPAGAAAYALNVTVVPDGPLAYLTTWPSGETRPLVSTLNSDGRIKANAAIVPAGENGGVEVYVTDSTHVILDVTGYFVPTASSSGLQFFPLPPCRVIDTRLAAGSLGGPALIGTIGRDFPIQTAPNCNIPSVAQAYSLNVTVVPLSFLLYLTVWQTGQPQPLASVLNAPNGTTTANAAIIPAGSNGGSISAYASSDTHLVVDINGYFAPPGTGGTYLYTIPPCRALDTRNPAGSSPTLGTTQVNLAGSGCVNNTSAQAFVLNSTVVPSGPLAYLTLWPDSQMQPLASTLNADPGVIASNMAIVPSSNGSIDAYATGLTYLIFDMFGYFAP